MGFDVRISGGAELYRLKSQLKQLSDTGLGRDMDKRLKSATKPLKPAIEAEIPRVMPSGYAPVLSASMSYRLASKTRRQSTELRYRVFGDGKQERRDVPALNKGTLRSPRGKKRRTWVSQSVRTGFVDKPVERLMPAVRKEMAEVLTDVAKKLRG
ncbi:hypothetical protein O7630_06730 [Micromonospora sp. WMMD718]|uniref:hypothetical protein n=1 Tax=unclassified Micromonospora TaxID=2617518 RepID=UPI00128DCE24|nr:MULTISPECIES: hypothetical protein [unclassified Micromonospora]MDG4750626.1 hypothetical protein [Micromonospora sp. WMMD718]